MCFKTTVSDNQIPSQLKWRIKNNTTLLYRLNLSDCNLTLSFNYSMFNYFIHNIFFFSTHLVNTQSQNVNVNLKKKVIRFYNKSTQSLFFWCHFYLLGSLFADDFWFLHFKLKLGKNIIQYKNGSNVKFSLKFLNNICFKFFVQACHF